MMEDEVWRIRVKDKVFDGSLDDLKLVVSKGLVQPTDKVKRGAEKWIEAREVPELHDLFSSLGVLPTVKDGDEPGNATQPSKVWEVAAPPPLPVVPPPVAARQVQPVAPAVVPPAAPSPVPAPIPAKPKVDYRKICQRHPETEARYYCTSCATWRCRNCVKLFEEVAMCPDCEVLCVKAEVFKVRAEETEKRRLSFGDELIRASTYPYRRPISTILIFLWVWLSASGAEAATNVATGEPVEKIMLGPFDNLGFIGLAVGFCWAEYLSYNIMIRGAEGKEDRGFGRISDFHQLFEPLVFWGVAVLIGLFPLCLHVYMQDLQGLTAVLIGGDPSKLGQTSVWHQVATAIFALWAVFVYPLEKVVGATKKTFSAMLNPFIIAATLFSLKKWLLPPFAVTILGYAILVGTIFITRSHNYGIMAASALLTLTALTSSSVIGAALNRGWETLDILTEDPEVFEGFVEKAVEKERLSGQSH